MQKVTLTAVYHNDKDRNGNPYKSQAGKPYTKCNIKCTEYGDKYLSGFDNKETQTWKIGDTVDIIIEQKGEYLNFSLPKKETGGLTEMDREMFMRMEKKIDSINWHIIEFLRAQKGGQPMYPSPEVEGIDTSKSGDVPEINPEDVPW